MFDITTIKNPEVVAFEEKIPGMFAALVQHETQAVQDVIARYARGRMGDVPLHVGSEIDLAVVTAIAAPVLANAVITSDALDLWAGKVTLDEDAASFEKKAGILVEDMVTRLRASVPLIVAKVEAATRLAARDLAASQGNRDA